MSTDYSPLEAALEKLTIYDVWQRLGLEGKPDRSCRSPFRQRPQPELLDLQERPPLEGSRHRRGWRRRGLLRLGAKFVA